jgi:ATP-dependent DNA helicase PIF1
MTTISAVTVNAVTFYAVKKGIQEGIYETWEQCRAQIDNFSGAQYKKFKTRDEAQQYMDTKEIVTGVPSVQNMGSSPTAGTTNPVPNPLSPDQHYAFTKYKLNQNIFITGPGGTGKSYLIKNIRDDLVARGQNHAICALTGCAAVLLGCCAKTIHSWAGIGIASGTQEEIVARVLKNGRTVARWRSIKTLIIDEVSMMSLKIFEVLDKIGRNARKQYLRPFGGIQVILIGDFYQLPPVGKISDPESRLFCFESPIWETTFVSENHIQLRTPHRQKDPEYIQVLEEVRSGKLSEKTINILADRLGATVPDSIIKPTKLFPRNADADMVNQNMYAQIREPEILYESTKIENMQFFNDTAIPIPQDVQNRCALLSREDINQQIELYMENNHLLKVVKLKKGAVVMCLANLDTDAGICNGSQGVVVDFVTGGAKQYPVVRFLNGVTMKIMPKVYQHDDYPTHGIEQLPLRLAWAFTIHKSQGVTLEIAEMDIGSRVFECGQTYVALSRVKSLSGLYLSGFNHTKIKTNPRVLAFYERMPTLTPEIMASAEELLNVFERCTHKPNENGVKIVKI